MNRLIPVVVALFMAGCAAKLPQYGNDPTKRQRAQIHTELASGYYAQRLYPYALEEYNTAVEKSDTDKKLARVIGVMKPAIDYVTNEATEKRLKTVLTTDYRNSSNFIG